MKPRFFESGGQFREWLEKNHDRADELLVGFHKRHTRRPSMTWPESVDAALCYGWIDGIRKRIDDESYSIRFTPRRRGSIWSAVNIRRAKELIELGLMRSAGLRAFETRDEKRANRYSYERATAALPPDFEKRFRSNKVAWKYFSAQPPGYRRVATHWVMSAKRDETRLSRLEKLIAMSAKAKRIY
jgi:uncharacterized protein YdeI (YjbR/CyaY-like superfamily)